MFIIWEKLLEESGVFRKNTSFRNLCPNFCQSGNPPLNSRAVKDPAVIDRGVSHSSTIEASAQ